MQEKANEPFIFTRLLTRLPYCELLYMEFNTDEVNQLIQNRRSVYPEMYTDETIDHKIIKQILENANCSHIISIGMKRHEGKIPEIEETACAVQNMWLTATAYGLGCYWGSGGITYKEEAKSFFDLEPADKLLGFLHLGIPEKWPEGRRKPIEDKVRWIK